MTEKIPGPRGLPFLGNVLDVLADDVPILALERLADIYGPIYQITVKGRRGLIVSSADLLEELLDEKRFIKVPPLALSSRPGPKGLFTARGDDADWGQAHRILMPAFSPLSVRDMFDDMKDVANQLILKWARKGPENRILVTDDFTRLTLDTIALCSMAYRFNSFYQDAMHPFVDAMLNVLQENGARVTRPGFVNTLMFQKNAKLNESAKFMRNVGQEIVEHRRSNPTDKMDLLNAMIFGVDPKTGQRLRDELIIEEMITFLVAGHETTSGLLSFLFLNLLRNSHAYLEAQKEVDEVIGKAPLQVSHLKDLKYLNAVLRETARLTPTAPLVTKCINPAIAHETVTLGHGRYRVEPDDGIMILLAKSQRDVSVYGEDAAEFKPERMLDEEFEKLPPGAWKPFGNGSRACIGRPFAWQEALMMTAMILQNFDLRLDDLAYRLKYKQTLTIKPLGLYIRASLRQGIEPTALDKVLHSNIRLMNGVADQLKSLDANFAKATSAGSKPVTILYGSNTGTCQAFAQRFASDSAAYGYKARIMEMDAAVDALTKGSFVVVITSSYEGQPPDNAARFVEWLQNCKVGSLTGVNFAVFGCGHRDWSKTFHRIPRLVDKLFTQLGAHRIAPTGLTDAAKGNMFGDFEDWLDNDFWPNQAPNNGDTDPDNAMSIEISTQARASSLRYDVSIGTVQENKTLTFPGEPVKCHLKVRLPSGSAYECGDYLAVLPLNSEKNVQRIITHFKLPWDAVVTLKNKGPSTIPANTPLPIYDLLRSYVELAQPATRKNLKTCAQYTEAAADKEYLETLAGDACLFDTDILAKRTSVFDILRDRPSVLLPFSEFLATLPPLRVRQYSISSSPLADPETCTIIYGVIGSPGLSNPDVHFEGVAGTYLHSLQAGDQLQISLRPSAKKTFRLPLDAENTPLLMFCAGTGLAPFRGFLQQRAVQIDGNPGRKLARAVLFVGCRSQTKDRLYGQEMDDWAKKGVVEIKYAFSQEKEKSGGCAYVPEAMMRDAEEIVGLWRADARIFVCGSRKLAKGVEEAAQKIVREVAKRKFNLEKLDSEDSKEIEKWFKDVMSERVASDMFD